MPADRPTVQAAVSDASCSLVAVAAGIFDEGVVVTRTVTLQGAGATTTRLTRPLRVVGATVLVIEDIAIDLGGTCYALPFEVAIGASVAVTPGTELAVPAAGAPVPPCPLFDDGFESGTTLAWSEAT